MVILNYSKNFYSRIKLFFKIFILSPKVWKKPKKSEIVIYDKSGSEVLERYLKRFNVEIISLRGESINVYCVFFTILNHSFWKGQFLKAYAEAYIKICSPKICITFTHNNTSFYDVSTNFPNLKTVMIQNGNADNWLSSDSKNNSFYVNYMFVFNNAIASFFKKNIKGEVIVAGSLKNNLVPISSKCKADKVVFISTYVPKYDNSDYVIINGDEVSWSDFVSSELRVIILLKEWCKKNGKKLIIAGCTLENRTEEIMYFSKYLNNYDFKYIERKNIYSTYKLIDQAEIVVTVDSTMGFEAIARGKKTAFFSGRAISINRPDRSFGWPAKLNSNGPFWTDGQNDKDFLRVMNLLKSTKNSDWKLLANNHMENLMILDKKNSKLVNLIAHLLTKENNKFK